MIFPSGSPLFFNAAISCSSVKSRYDSNMFLPRLLIQYLPRRFFYRCGVLYHLRCLLLLLCFLPLRCLLPLWCLLPLRCLLPHALPHNLIGKHTCCHRCVQGIDIPLHRNGCHKITVLAHQSANTLAFTADDKTDRSF